MPLDPHLKEVLLQMAAAPQPNGLEEMRAAVIANSARMPRREVTIAGTRDLTIPGPAGGLPARLYTPEGEGPHPLTVYFHGGGFVAYSIETHDSVCRELCAVANTAVLSVDYRLAPEHRFPAGVDDAYAALVWAAAHGEELGADTSRLAVAGDSAGASLSIACTLRARDEDGPRIRAQLLIYPAADFVNVERYPSRRENAEGYFLTEERMKFFGQMYLADPTHAAHPHVSPLHAADLRGLPPALVLTAEFDPLRDEGVAYAEALNAAGGRATHQPGPGMIHGFANMTALSPAAAALLDQAAAWLKAELA
ncbi:alpha/beta hydrolase (plasmid) [Deinococcus metallilatus]|uniref:Acetyl esterase n=1 Tax=Deinococcus metallilatus TaxID=1211322 RepID=A0AAJ5JZP1_9DEIO|nr:alpha/beta hydrolase [Deinococcus metallilatus]MBB5297302.1 acetyl esterase [Deinococcus metallilatus]QBY06952.1 alpha/beta hydrolase [Deinococcus metallilatus]TLK31899.1 alpha/beta hydrolase [Deinococcus metallilatus]GMA17134.1 lipase [Deinococcus metallilatus]